VVSLIYNCFSGIRLQKNVTAERDSEVTRYNTALDRLMQEFRDYAVRDVHGGVARIGESCML